MQYNRTKHKQTFSAFFMLIPRFIRDFVAQANSIKLKLYKLAQPPKKKQIRISLKLFCC